MRAASLARPYAITSGPAGVSPPVAASSLGHVTEARSLAACWPRTPSHPSGLERTCARPLLTTVAQDLRHAASMASARPPRPAPRLDDTAGVVGSLGWRPPARRTSFLEEVTAKCHHDL